MTSIECNHKEVETARKGEEVCIKIDPILSLVVVMGILVAAIAAWWH